MELVLDNNSLFSIINPRSISAFLFSSIRAKFIAPEFIKFELEKYKNECLSKSRLSEQQFEMRIEEINKSIKFFNLDNYYEYIKIALKNLSDPKDSLYLALALFRNSAIWSNDLHLQKQKLTIIYTTKELVNMFLRNEI